ncbi:MAG TPA: DUF3025 domain-containing protein, partial [Nitrososphaera sp.]|nr:DUF3025 domain-containing protein [Nitrososphaera sp.]
VHLFCHALLEKLARPYKAITAHSLVCWVQAGFQALPIAQQQRIVDHQLAAQLATQPLSPSSFFPMPVLGVPGWWAGQDREFYADTAVFRERRPS